MASGQPPKRKEDRARRNIDKIPTTELTVDNKTRGFSLPPLPKQNGKPNPWHPQTVKWWATWRKSAQAKTMSATDWDYLLDTAILHHSFWCGDLKVAGELRQRVAKFGATPEDRLRLRFEIGGVDDVKTHAAARQPDKSRETRLTLLVGGQNGDSETA